MPDKEHDLICKIISETGELLKTRWTKNAQVKFKNKKGEQSALQQVPEYTAFAEDATFCYVGAVRAAAIRLNIPKAERTGLINRVLAAARKQAKLIAPDRVSGQHNSVIFSFNDNHATKVKDVLRLNECVRDDLKC